MLRAEKGRPTFDLCPELDTIRCDEQRAALVAAATCVLYALVAQSVEHVLGKNGVTSSSLVEGS